jgi:hypothetical protein
VSRDGCVRCAPAPNHPELTGEVVGARTVVCLHASHLPYCHGDIPAPNVQHVSTQEHVSDRQRRRAVWRYSILQPLLLRRQDVVIWTLMLTKCSASSRWRCGTGSRAGHSREWAHTTTSRPVPVASVVALTRCASSARRTPTSSPSYGRRALSHLEGNRCIFLHLSHLSPAPLPGR